jgi:hypothetical protein
LDRFDLFNTITEDREREQAYSSVNSSYTEKDITIESVDEKTGMISKKRIPLYVENMVEIGVRI